MPIDIGIDCDGVICHTNQELIKRAKTLYDLDIAMEDITQFEIEKVLPMGDKLLDFYFTPDFYSELEVREGAKEVIKKLMSEGDDVVVVTALPPNCVPARAKWFEENLPFFPQKSILYCSRKDKFSAKVLLDDALHNLDTSIVEYPILFARPWNVAGRNRYVTVETWFQFYEVICHIREGKSYEWLLQWNKEKMQDRRDQEKDLSSLGA